MKKENKRIIKQAFGLSLIGRFLCRLEWMVTIGISAMLVLALINWLSPSLSNKESVAIMYIAFLWGMAIGLLLSSILPSLFAWRLLPPSKNSVRKYIDERTGDISSSIASFHNKIGSLEQEMKELNEFSY